MQKSSIAILSAFVLMVAVIGFSSANATLWTPPVVPTLSVNNTMTPQEYTVVYASWVSEQRQPAGSVLMNPVTNEWCVSNCGKLTQVDSSLFATEETQKAKLERTSQFLNETYPQHNGYWCEAQKSIHKYGTFHC